jgi:hypothetical protein
MEFDEFRRCGLYPLVAFNFVALPSAVYSRRHDIKTKPFGRRKFLLLPRADTPAFDLSYPHFEFSITFASATASLSSASSVKWLSGRYPRGSSGEMTVCELKYGILSACKTGLSALNR